MSTELQDALSRAADGGRKAFEARDAVEVIAPATRRVRRHRAWVRTAQVAGAFAALGGVLWGVDLAANSTTSAADEAPTSAASAEPTPDVTRFDSVVTADQLVSQAVPYVRGAMDEGRQRGLLCHPGADNPRLDPDNDGVDRAYVLTDCDAVWAAQRPLVSLENVTAEAHLGSGSSDTIDTITMRWTIVNVSDSRLEVSPSSASGALTLDRDGVPSADLAVSGMSVSATSVWASDTTVSALLQNVTDVTVLAPGESLQFEQAFPVQDGWTAMQNIVAGQPAQFTAFIRLPFDDENEPDELLLEVRSPEQLTFGLGG